MEWSGSCGLFMPICSGVHVGDHLHGIELLEGVDMKNVDMKSELEADEHVANVLEVIQRRHVGCGFFVEHLGK